MSNSTPSLTCDALLHDAGEHIGGDSPRLDAELLLSHVTGLSRTTFRAWPEREVPPEQAQAFQALVSERARGLPVAYLLGEQEFWSLPLRVSPSTLIPRPDTECLVEAVLSLPLPERARVLDLGTGTGAIALALASEKPGWRILASDRIPEAVALARENSQRLQLPITVIQSHWFDEIPEGSFDLLVSNPPYVPASDHHLREGDVRFEPASALVAGDDGLDDIRLLVTEGGSRLSPGGWMLLEHGYDQAEAVRNLFAEAGWHSIDSLKDYGGNDRMTLARTALSHEPERPVHAE
ncbi:peptide chain release factor N(5)-glutamine methyltransferase [Marinobacter daepoensis]|uniref:Release factor glutamine methyltransferase n=1 Tax=Marinobacter daepoensis TaxID=262077 RepID=A0ABS3BMT9_9GAMM|nr:peptide chain release factor N(5)-glutamine methyltransferase [Marinobacter daepoensis]MBN7771500.1 peptide chain release factor N(5)-glutamine methyltransferase [Marinobacter daepoensis]MBY6034230.1 peptide chain release factor N(5)-glutamine methyltransferase [Marinobacter daepoensis]MBY6080100.1 peptide chain release factor N(5)-glutamine methyltransferase [Marinobacter daepoensis]